MTVRRRHVFYFNGFDPKGAASIHGLYGEQAPLQGKVTGVQYAVGPRQRMANGNSQWTVDARPVDAGPASALTPALPRRANEELPESTRTTFEFVRWDDIVRAHWPRTGWQVLAGSLRGYQAALASWDSLQRVYRASPRTLVALAYPAGFWIGTLLLGAIVAAVIVAIAGTGAVALVIAAAAWLAVLWAALVKERQWNTSWLLRIYQFAGDWRRGRTPAVPQRTRETAEAIVAALQDQDVDEVLLVGFSVGSLLAVSTAVEVQRLATASGLSLDRFSMLTLGHCIPLLGLMKGAGAYREELRRLGTDPHVPWIDFSSPTDWGSFPLVDPIAICNGPATADRPHSPRMLSPRFHTMFDPAVYAGLVGNKRRIHLQYIMAGERPALYDYFAITAGPQRLADRVNSATVPAPQPAGALVA